MPFDCIWHEERFYTAGSVLQNSVGGLVGEKPWASMPLNWYGFTMLTRITFLALESSTNILLITLTSWLLTLYAQSTMCIMVNRMYMASQQSSAVLSWSIVSLF